MGKGDQRTKKGKRVRASWGVSRPRTDKGRGRFTRAVAGVAVAEEVAEKPAKKAPAKKAPAKKAAPAAKAAPAKKSSGGDKLTKIEGIGPKIAETLTAAGIATFAELAKAEPAKIAEIIADVRGNHVPDTWPEQAALAAADKWDELEKLQDELDGGVRK